VVIPLIVPGLKNLDENLQERIDESTYLAYSEVISAYPEVAARACTIPSQRTSMRRRFSTIADHRTMRERNPSLQRRKQFRGHCLMTQFCLR
jgi:hypothetical protein